MCKGSQVLVLLILVGTFGTALADPQVDYFSGGELVAIGGSATALMTAGIIAKHSTGDRPANWTTPGRLEASISRFFGGTPQPGKRNFLDSDFGSGVTTTLGAALVFAADMSVPRDDRAKDVLQGQFMYLSGAVATRGLTDIVKGLVRRQRPISYFAPELARTKPNYTPEGERHSFFSGHASGAFFSMTYANLRIREAMRADLTPGDYRDWRWVAPAVTYGWATFVALSRIQAYRHYLSDVTAGALVGYAVGVLVYELGKNVRETADGQPTPLMIRVSFSL
ncbi:MAG: phosphatase PAP2 family protein [candidate division Zixibacteria bacterium]|nr:phosphatase PAP2 family protein [candidate division Zixibacteria bacterium]